MNNKELLFEKSDRVSPKGRPLFIFISVFIVLGYFLVDENYLFSTFCPSFKYISDSNGAIPGYKVEATKSYLYEYRGWLTIIHLYPEKSVGYFPPGEITGHYYNGRLERVFYCGYPKESYGCNSVIITLFGNIWDPCPANRDEIKPFTQAEIEYARKKLKQAENLLSK